MAGRERGFIAAFLLVDGAGARLAGTVLGHYCWLSIINVTLFLVIVSLIRPGTITQLRHLGKFDLIFGGATSFLAYALIENAFTQASVAVVSALREVSIVFALLIGIYVSCERAKRTSIPPPPK